MGPRRQSQVALAAFVGFAVAWIASALLPMPAHGLILSALGFGLLASLMMFCLNLCRIRT